MSLDLVKSIRTRTGLSYKDILKAVNELGIQDEDKIIDHLRQQGVLKAQAKEGRETAEGGIFSYVHEGKLGVIVMLKCETDFNSRSDGFKKMGNNIALHIAANQPKFVSVDQMDQGFVEKEMALARELLISEGKPEALLDKILVGKKDALAKEVCLNSQPYLIDTSMTVDEYIATISHATGEKIFVEKFEIYTLGN